MRRILVAFVVVPALGAPALALAAGGAQEPAPSPSPPLMDLQAVSDPASVPPLAPDQEGTPPLIEQPVTEQPPLEPLPETPVEQPAEPEEQEEPPADVEVPDEVGQAPDEEVTPPLVPTPQATVPEAPSLPLARTGYDPLLAFVAGYAMLLTGLLIVKFPSLSGARHRPSGT